MLIAFSDHSFERWVEWAVNVQCWALHRPAQAQEFRGVIQNLHVPHFSLVRYLIAGGLRVFLYLVLFFMGLIQGIIMRSFSFPHKILLSQRIVLMSKSSSQLGECMDG